jgi:putative tricarboxylic transport membrane protein
VVTTGTVHPKEKATVLTNRGTRVGRLAVAFLVAAAAASAAACESQDVGSDAGPSAAAVQYPTKTIQLMAPAAPGGGWDSTARTMQKALQDAGLLNGQSVEVRNVPGAAGTIGLAELVTSHQKNAYQLMITGLVMVGGEVVNKTPVHLTETTPIATLTAEPEVIVVKSDSKLTTLKQLLDAIKANPTSVKWGGGSAGGTDQILVGLLAKAAGLDAKQVITQYVSYAGGGEVKAALLSGDATVGVSSVSEFADLVKAGQLRALAVSAASGLDAGGGSPTQSIKEAGYDVELMNWRGIVAPPGITEGERQAITKLVEQLHSSAQWQQALAEKKWQDFYKTGNEAKAFFTDESTRIKTVLTEAGIGS